MRVLRTVTSENSAATKNPLASTKARTASKANPASIASPSGVHINSRQSTVGSRQSAVVSRPSRLSTDDCDCRLTTEDWRLLSFSTGKEMRIDELVDGALI